MARALHKLTDRGCRSATKSGLLSDGGGLYLEVRPSGSKSWTFVWRGAGRRRQMGLGGFPAVPLARARQLAADARAAVAAGEDPILERRQTAEPTFEECVEEFLASMEGQWRNAKHRAQWRTTLTTHARPLLPHNVSVIDTHMVLRVLKPIWQKTPETASRLRGRIERVLDFAKTRGWRTGENPALWRGHLSNVLPPRTRLSRGHHAAMPREELPAFLQKIRGSSAASARALELAILTAARSGEVRLATWDELDLGQEIWTVPASRMKAGRVHRVPLGPRALALLGEMQKVRESDFVFPGAKAGSPLSVMALAMVLRRHGAADYTVHGFRSTFRDWAADATSFPREVAEAALAHTVGDATERAYRRGDALQRRRELMLAWEAFCDDRGAEPIG